jgi:hypothetical protein
MPIENMLMFYDEVRDHLQSFGILTREEIERQQTMLRALPVEGLPPAWGIYRVTAET